jgi:hypothetical protein
MSLVGKDDSQSSLAGSITPNTSLSHGTEQGAFKKLVSCLDEIAFSCSEIQESADLVEDVEGSSGIKDGRIFQGIVVY